MSDGERSVLYLAAQVLCVPENKTLIIDEPEVHLHPSLMGRLWRALESARPDCLFVFITHDVQFAALHKDSPRIWVKSLMALTGIGTSFRIAICQNSCFWSCWGTVKRSLR